MIKVPPVGCLIPDIDIINTRLHESKEYFTVSQTVTHGNKTYLFEADFYIIYDGEKACADIQDIRFEEVS